MNSKKLEHPALKLGKNKKVVFTALSKRFFYMRFLISKFVLKQDAVPINPFTSFDYFMLDTIERDVVREANNTLVNKADELWVFGDISNGVLAEILQAKEKEIPIRYFKITKDKDIEEILKEDLVFEDDIFDKKHLL